MKTRFYNIVMQIAQIAQITQIFLVFFVQIETAKELLKLGIEIEDCQNHRSEKRRNRKTNLARISRNQKRISNNEHRLPKESGLTNFIILHSEDVIRYSNGDILSVHPYFTTFSNSPQ